MGRVRRLQQNIHLYIYLFYWHTYYTYTIIPIVRSQTAITTIRYETRRIRFLLSPIGDFRDENNFLSTAVCSGYCNCSIEEKFRNIRDHAFVHITREKRPSRLDLLKYNIIILVLCARCVMVRWTYSKTKR